MNPVLAAALAATINGAFELWRIHANKPEGWKPTHDDYLALIAEVDAATKEARLEAARQRLNLPSDVEPLRETPQAPV
jgi:hypothetical protein